MAKKRLIMNAVLLINTVSSFYLRPDMGSADTESLRSLSESHDSQISDQSIIFILVGYYYVCVFLASLFINFCFGNEEGERHFHSHRVALAISWPISYLFLLCCYCNQSRVDEAIEILWNVLSIGLAIMLLPVLMLFSPLVACYENVSPSLSRMSFFYNQSSQERGVVDETKEENSGITVTA